MTSTLSTVAGAGVGTSAARPDGGLKVAGEFAFSSDLWADDMLLGATLRSPHPRARIRRVDITGALALPGVHAVLTLDDLAPAMAKRRMLRHSNSGTPLDKLWAFALADGEVSYVGETVAFVVAESAERARDAAEAVVVDYAPLAPIVSLREAVEPGTALLLVDFWTNPSHTEPVFAALMAGEWLTASGEADCYSVQDVEEWLQRTGLDEVCRSSPPPYDRIYRGRPPSPGPTALFSGVGGRRRAALRGATACRRATRQSSIRPRTSRPAPR